MYSKRRERCRHRPGSTRRPNAVERRPLPDLRRREHRGDDVPGRRQPRVVVQRARVDAVDRGGQRGRRGAGRGARADWLLAFACPRSSPRGRRSASRAPRVVAVAAVRIELRLDRAQQRDRRVGDESRRRHCGVVGHDRIADTVGRSRSASWPPSSSGAGLRRWRAPIGSPCRSLAVVAIVLTIACVRAAGRSWTRAGADDELVARPGCRHRVSGLVDPDVRGLLPVHAIATWQRDRGLLRSRADERLDDAARRDRRACGRLDAIRARCSTLWGSARLARSCWRSRR